MKQYFSYMTTDSHTKRIEIELINGKIGNLFFEEGCNGNLKAMTRLVYGMDPKIVADKLAGTSCPYCNGKTSCPDQLSKALNEMLSLIARNDQQIRTYK